jgi:fluoroquinolone resistance protein
MEVYEQAFSRDEMWGDLRDARFDSCTFRGVDWSGKDLRGARFEDCVFHECDWSNARMLGVGLQDVRFEKCKMVGVDFAVCNTLGWKVQVVDCRLDSANFEGMDVRGMTWKGGRAQGADFTGAQADGVDFDGVDLTDAVFERTRLEGANFRTAFGWRIRPEENRIRGAKFRRDDLAGLVAGWNIDLE